MTLAILYVANSMNIQGRVKKGGTFFSIHNFRKTLNDAKQNCNACSFFYFIHFDGWYCQTWHHFTRICVFCDDSNLSPIQVTSNWFSSLPRLGWGFQGTVSTSGRGRVVYTRSVLSSVRFVKPRLKFSIFYLIGIFVINLDDCYRSLGS